MAVSVNLRGAGRGVSEFMSKGFPMASIVDDRNPA